MNTITNNIINEFININQTVFAKNEIITIISRVTNTHELPILESNGIIINCSKHQVTFDGINHKLPKKEFNLLYYLISNKNKILPKDIILRDVWGTDICVVDRTIDVHIRKLRGRFNLSNIETIKGLGYKWKE